MCPTARSRGDIYNEHVKSEKGCKIGLETSKVRISLRNEHFRAPHFENVHFLS